MRRMRAAGHEVLCAVPAGDDAAEAAIRAIGEEDPAFRKGPAVRLCHYPLDRKGLNPLRDMATMHALYRLFRQEKPDLLFASTIKPVIYGCMAARLARVPHIYATITGLGYAFEADNFFKKCVNRLSIGLYHCALAGAEGVFFQNRDDAELFRKVGILRRSARVLMARGTGVDIRRFAEAPLPPLPAEGCAPEEREIIFLLVGRLLEAKGLPEYAAAARRNRAWAAWIWPRCAAGRTKAASNTWARPATCAPMWRPATRWCCLRGVKARPRPSWKA